MHICVTQDGWTALIRAAFNGRAEIVRVLLAAGADTNLQSKVSADGDVRKGWQVAYMLHLIYAQLTVSIECLCYLSMYICLVIDIYVYMYL